MEDSHDWRKYTLRLSVGKHYLSAESKRGNLKIEKEFEVRDKHWAVLQFSTKKQGQKAPPYFNFEIFDGPIGFL